MSAQTKKDLIFKLVLNNAGKCEYKFIFEHVQINGVN